MRCSFWGWRVVDGSMGCLTEALGGGVAQLVERGNEWARLTGRAPRLHFLTANATVSLGSLLSTYPGCLSLLSIQVRPPAPSQAPCSPRLALCVSSSLSIVRRGWNGLVDHVDQLCHSLALQPLQYSTCAERGMLTL